MNDLFEIEFSLMEGVSITIPSLSLTIVWIRPRTIVAVHGLSRSFTVVRDCSLSFPVKKTHVIVRGHYFNEKLDKAAFTLRAAK